MAEAIMMCSLWFSYLLPMFEFYSLTLFCKKIYMWSYRKDYVAFRLPDAASTVCIWLYQSIKVIPVVCFFDKSLRFCD